MQTVSLLPSLKVCFYSLSFSSCLKKKLYRPSPSSLSFFLSLPPPPPPHRIPSHTPALREKRFAPRLLHALCCLWSWCLEWSPMPAACVQDSVCCDHDGGRQGATSGVRDPATGLDDEFPWCVPPVFGGSACRSGLPVLHRQRAGHPLGNY